MSADLLVAITSVLTLTTSAIAFVYHRLNQQDAKQQEQIDQNADDIDEFETSFAKLQTRLFGHPGDDKTGLSGDVAEVNDRLQAVEEHVQSHAAETNEALQSIQSRIDDVSLRQQDAPQTSQKGGDYGN